MGVEDRFLRRPETSSEARFVSRSRYSLAMHSTKDNYSVSLDNLARPVHQPKQPETIRLLRYYESRRMGPSMEKGRQLRGNRTKEDCVLDEGAIIPPGLTPNPLTFFFFHSPGIDHQLRFSTHSAVATTSILFSLSSLPARFYNFYPIFFLAVVCLA
jgi:hypothetical protein